MSTPRKSQIIPDLPGVPPEAAEQIRTIAQVNHNLEARIRSLENSGFLTQQKADLMYSPPVMAKELSANGSAPLNIVSVSGRLIVQPQPKRTRRQ
jgi:hypothetical protein